MILVANTKGGCGKSTTSMQLLAPWILSRIGRAKVVEIDDENHDSADFEESQIESEQVTIGQEGHASHAINRLIDKTQDHYIIGDIGGNRTCSLILRELGNTSFDTYIDMIVIPITSTGQDVVNARKTLKIIKESMPKFTGKIALVITRAETTDPELLEEIMPDAFAMKEKHGLEGPLVIPSMSCFPSSRFMKRTAYELAEAADTLNDELEKALLKARRNPSERRHLSRLSRTVIHSRDARPHLEQQFEILDNLLDIKARARDLDLLDTVSAKPGKSGSGSKNADRKTAASA